MIEPGRAVYFKTNDIANTISELTEGDFSRWHPHPDLSMQPPLTGDV